MSFSKQQVKDFVKQVRKNAGDGWKFLVPELREALILQKVLHVFMGQDESIKFTSVDIQKLTEDMLTEAGISETP